MVRFETNEQLVQALSVDLTPIHRLAPPSQRVLLWLAIVGAVALALAMVSDVGAMIQRLVAAPDMWLAEMGSVLTAVLAAAAAFQLSLPDRKAAWALLPLPAVLLWIGASGMGCLRPWSIADAYPMPPDGTEHCLMFILGLSLPLSLLLIVMLRRGFSLRPNLTANHWRPRLRLRGRHAPQLHSSLRCGSNRFNRPCIRGRDCYRGEHHIRRPPPYEEDAFTRGQQLLTFLIVSASIYSGGSPHNARSKDALRKGRK
jgi:hypothetical protein